MVPPPLPGADTIEVAVTAHAGEVDLQVLIEDGALTPPTVEEDD
jgi:hypothetical protein